MRDEKCTVRAYETKDDGCLVTFGNGEQLLFSYDEFYKYSLFDTEGDIGRTFEELMSAVYEDRAYFEGVRESLKSRKTSGEIRKAISREIPEEERERAIAHLKEEQYIDDRKYAVSFVKKYVNEKCCSKKMTLIQGLAKGLPEEEIQYAFEELEINDKITAYRAFEKKSKEDSVKKYELSGEKADALKKKKKMASFLSSKGFDFEIINEIINLRNEEGDGMDD